MIDTREKFADVFEITDAELKYSLEERQIIIKQFQDEMKSIISTLRNYVSELKYMVDNKLDVSAITHLTFGVDSHLLNAFPVIYKYRECIVMYLLDDNYQMNHDLWNELKNIAEELIKNMNRVKDQRLYYDHYEPAYDFFEHRITQEGLLKFPDCYTELIQEIDCSRYTGMDLMNVLNVALSHIRDLMTDIKDSSNYYENDTLEKIYNLNYDLFVRMYWPEIEKGFRSHVTAIQKGQINEECLYERRSSEILTFEGNSLGIIWRDFEHDKANLALKLKNKSLSDDKWKTYFNAIKRFDEYDKWIDELVHPNVEEKVYPISDWDKIFKIEIDIVKIKSRIPYLLPENISKTHLFVLHKILEEINWLHDERDIHFLKWFNEVYGWTSSAYDFKSIDSRLKESHSLDWNIRTLTSEKISKKYIDLASKIRNEFVVELDGHVVKRDNKKYFIDQECYIEHKKKL